MRSAVGIHLLPAQAVAVGQGGGGCQSMLMAEYCLRKLQIWRFHTAPLLIDWRGHQFTEGLCTSWGAQIEIAYKSLWKSCVACSTESTV